MKKKQHDIDKQEKKNKKLKKAAFEEHSFDDDEGAKVVSIVNKKRQLKSNDSALEPKLKKLKKGEKVLPKLQLFQESASDATIVSSKNKGKKLKSRINIKESEEGKSQQGNLQSKKKTITKGANVLNFVTVPYINLYYLGINTLIFLLYLGRITLSK